MTPFSDEREAQVYHFICRHIDRFTRPPTIREIAKGCFMSRSNVVRYLDRLEAHGRIVREAGKARGISLPNDDACL